MTELLGRMRAAKGAKNQSARPLCGQDHSRPPQADELWEPETLRSKANVTL
jgi:hypothetical protein